MSSTPNPDIKLYDTLTREKRTFTPLDPTNVGMYVCGVTPYDDSHIGHARAYVVFDVLYRLLRHVYGENGVTYVRNFTDIDDKIIQRANELGQNPTDVSEKNIQSFYEDMDALNILRPNFEPRVSTSMPEIVQMVDDLIARNMAYVTASGDVMFDVPAFEKTGGHQPFGTLARRVFDKLQARVEGDEEKRDPRDFAVWKANAKSATKMEQAFHPKDLGAKHFNAAGRPGWHIECSVMSKQHLGPTFDIHGGGEDLQFPHHCCEIAQSESLLPAGQQMANYWLHNGFITVNGTKMSKSLGNFTTIKDALKKYPPEAVRFWLLKSPYREPIDYTDEALKTAEAEVKYLVTAASKVDVYEDVYGKFIVKQAMFTSNDKLEAVIKPLFDDLNGKQFTDNLVRLAEKANLAGLKGDMDEWRDNASILATALRFIGIREDLLLDSEKEQQIRLKKDLEVFKILEIRKAARASKNFAESDRLRDVLKSDHGIIVEDGPNGQTWRRA